MSERTFDINILANPEIFEQNRLKPVADHIAFASEEELLSNNSSYRKSLNGKWRFHFARNLAQRPHNFYEEGFDYSGFEFINVPGHFETQGFGKNHYTNIAYPWEGHEDIKPGQIPKDYNPVGSYIKTFTIPSNFLNTFISFQGVDSAFAVWLNGRYVGYSEDSNTPADFDLTNFVKAGTNYLAVQVFKYSSGSWLEDQDFLRFSGIFRDVFIYTKPRVHINDLFITSDLFNNYSTAKINVSLEILGSGHLLAYLYDKDGVLVAQKKVAIPTKDLCFDLDECDLWSAEKPNLYSLLLEVQDENGMACEYLIQKVGIREFKLINNIMCINGKRIVFNGVNRHEFYPRSGRVTVDIDDIKRDLLIMKDLNINAVRTSHYPNNSAFYHLCDEIGLYVINETNLETHGSWQALGRDIHSDNIVPGNKKEWKAAVLARGKAMLERDKNHACILMNSCGNEAFGGSTIYELSQYFRERDPRRIVHYEGVFHDRSFNQTSDIESQMYPSVNKIEPLYEGEALNDHNVTSVLGVKVAPGVIKEHLMNFRDKPFICCEYTHAMGNSCGGMKEYTDLSHTDPLYQGGFIWDFVDQALWVKNHDGNEVLAYGGDFDDRPNDGNFCCNGILFADRTYSPKCAEVKFNYQPFAIKVTSNNFTIENYQLFTNLNEYITYLKVLVNGELIYDVCLGRLNLEPLAKQSFDIPSDLADEFVFAQNKEVAFIVEIVKDDDLENTVAFGQQVFGKYVAPATIDKQQLKVVNSPNNIGVIGDNFSLMFSKSKGFLVSIVNGQQELLKQPMCFNFFRAPTDNDQGNGMPNRLGLWKLAGSYAHCVAENTKFEVIGDKDNCSKVIVSFDHILGCTRNAHVYTTYTIDEYANIEFKMEYKHSDELPIEMIEFGLLCKLKGDYSNIKYYGKGPVEGYVDRDNGLQIGVYESNIYDEYVPYIVPQECGNHNQTRYVKVMNDKFNGIEFSAVDEYFNFSALPYTPDELEIATHDYELKDNNNSVIKLSSVQMGIGGDDSWGALPLRKYRLLNEDRTFTLKMKLI